MNVLTDVADALPAEQAAQHFERFFQVIVAHDIRVEGDAGAVEFFAKAPGAQTEFNAAARHLVQRGDLLGQDRWVTKVVSGDEGAERSVRVVAAR
jgi:hypothetical protein